MNRVQICRIMQKAEAKPHAGRVLRELAEQANSDGIFRLTELILQDIANNAYMAIEEVEFQLEWLHISGHINVGEYLDGEAVYAGFRTPRREKHLLSKSSYNGRIYEELFRR